LPVLRLPTVVITAGLLLGAAPAPAPAAVAPAAANQGAAAKAASPAERWSSGRVAVRWRAGGVGAPRGRARTSRDLLGVSMVRAADPEATASSLRRRPDVLWAEPEAVRRPLADGGGRERAELGAEPAWAADRRMQGEGSEIAIIDDGVNPRHVDLAARGKVIDGGDCTTTAKTCAGRGGLTPGETTHGTSVAAVAAGARNGRGTVGAAPAATVVAYQVFEGNSLDGAWARDESIAKALVAAATRGVDVANLSLGGPTDSQLLRHALATARARNPRMVIVAAAGNDGSELAQYPAAGDGVLSVGASERRSDGSWTVADFSNRADADVLAPGVGVNAGSGELVDGTSFSAPQVAGIAAGLAAVGAAGDEARAALIAGARAPGSRPYGPPASGNGRADALRALRLVRGSAGFTAVTVNGGAQVANLVGRRTVEAIRVVPRRFGPGILDATAGSVTAARSSARNASTGGRVVRRTLATYAAPAHSLRTRDARIRVRGEGRQVGSAWIRLVPPVNGPEGAPVTNGATAADRLLFGSRSRVVHAVSLQAGQRLTITVTQPADICPEGSPSCNPLLLWTPARGGGTANATELPELVDMPNIGTHVLTARRTGRYLFGLEAMSGGENGVYRVRARWANPVGLTTSAAALSPNGDRWGDTLTVTSGVASRARGRLVIDVFDRRGRSVRTLTNAARTGPVQVRVRWNGRTNGNDALPDGTYTVRARLVGPGGDTSGRSIRVRLDRTRPRVTGLRAAPGKLFPEPDGFRDAAALRWRASEALVRSQVDVLDARGRRVWTARSGALAAGATGRVLFRGRGSGGSWLPAGRYTFAVTMVDRAGNRARSARAGLYIAWPSRGAAGR
jgi:hypothetical protein